MPRVRRELRGTDHEIGRTTVIGSIGHVDACRREAGAPVLQLPEDDGAGDAMWKDEPRIDAMEAHASNSS